VQKIAATLTLLNSADEPIASLQPAASTNGSGAYALSGTLSGQNAVALLVHIEHQGFTSFARRVPIEANVYMQARLSALAETQVAQSNATSISGATTNGFTLQVNDEGNDAPAMSISIPASSLPAGTQSLSAAIKTYDPTDPNDAQYFPGSYADSTGNGLVSVAFNFTEVKTSGGESLKALAQQAQIARQAPGAIGFAAPPEPVIINRTIPTNSCATLEKLGDANAELAGFQIPVYTYNPRSGLWDLLGYGTVYTEAGVAVASGATDLNCGSQTYVLEIKVTNEIFLSDWWNLDYPLQFAEPKKRCASLHVVNEAAEPLAGVYGLITGDGDFSNAYFVSDENGNARVEVDVFSDTVSNANYIVWGNAGGQGPLTLTETCPATQVHTIVIKRPQLCKIKGKIEIANKPYGNIAVWAASTEAVFTEYFFAIGATDATGMYSLDVACDSTYNVQVVLAETANYPSIRVDNTVGANELTDDGKQVYVKTINLTQPPYPTTLYIGGYIAESQQGALMFIGLDAAFPIQYNLQLKNTLTNQVFTSANGRLDFDADLLGEESNTLYVRIGNLRVPVVLPEDLTNVVVTGSFTDAFGIEKSVNIPVINLPEDFLNLGQQ